MSLLAGAVLAAKRCQNGISSFLRPFARFGQTLTQELTMEKQLELKDISGQTLAMMSAGSGNMAILTAVLRLMQASQVRYSPHQEGL